MHATHPHRVSLPSCTVSRSYLRGACSTGIVCVHVPSLPTSRVRHVNRAYRRHFFLDAKSTPAPPSTLQFHRSRRTDLFLGRDPLFLVGIRAARIKRWHISDLLPRATSIPPRVFLYFACFHSYAVYGRAETLHELRSSTRKIRRFLLLLVVGNDRWEDGKFISRICRTVFFSEEFNSGFKRYGLVGDNKILQDHRFIPFHTNAAWYDHNQEDCKKAERLKVKGISRIIKFRWRFHFRGRTQL